MNPTFINRVRSGGGIGAVAGIGSDFSLTETLALTTGVWAARTHIHASGFMGNMPAPTTFQPYWLRAYRLQIGIKWNPEHLVSVGP